MMPGGLSWLMSSHWRLKVETQIGNGQDGFKVSSQISNSELEYELSFSNSNHEALEFGKDYYQAMDCEQAANTETDYEKFKFRRY